MSNLKIQMSNEAQNSNVNWKQDFGKGSGQNSVERSSGFGTYFFLYSSFKEEIISFVIESFGFYLTFEFLNLVFNDSEIRMNLNIFMRKCMHFYDESI